MTTDKPRTLADSPAEKALREAEGALLQYGLQSQGFQMHKVSRDDLQKASGDAMLAIHRAVRLARLEQEVMTAREIYKGGHDSQTHNRAHLIYDEARAAYEAAAKEESNGNDQTPS